LKVCCYRLGDLEKAVAFGALRLELLARASASAGAGRAAAAGAARSGRSVVAYSLWGTQTPYCVGAMVNARLVPTLMPGWIARFYVGDDVPAPVLDDLAGQSAQIVRERDIPDFVPNYMWRFLVADDPEVSRFACRDADARITAKDAAAVDEWAASGFGYHVMRDHVFHNDLILSGLWGGFCDASLAMTALIRDYQTANGGDRRYGVDQLFLARAVWPLIREDALTHDSYYRLGETRPFPVGGKGDERDHVGIGRVGNEARLREARRYGLPWP
jgi:hypothetical protein